MINRFLSLLCLIFVYANGHDVKGDVALYVTLGPEAPTILRMLIGDDHVMPVTAARLADVLPDRSITAVIVPEEWLDESQLEMVRASGDQLVLIKRHTSVANILDNIHTLAALTGSQD